LFSYECEDTYETLKKRREEKERLKREEEQRRIEEKQRRNREEEQRRFEEVQRRKREEEKSRQWAQQGLCPYCGGQMGGLFSKKCKSCGKAG
jgi:hypothetical protein